jgi:hypothetical protein
MGRRQANQLDAIRQVILQQQQSNSAGAAAAGVDPVAPLPPLLGDEDTESVTSSLIEDLPPPPFSGRSRSLSSRETVHLLASQRQPGGSLNWDYVNSAPRLYLLVHNLEDILQTSAQNSAHVHRAFSILAACPVVSIVASMTSLNTPLHAAWGSSHLHAFQWSYQHTPTPLPHDPLPEVVTAFSNESRKTHTDRADTLKYVLKSLTKKHHEIIKFLLTSTAPPPASAPPQDQDPPASSSSPSPSPPPPGVGWFTLLSHAMSQFVVKGDSDLRQLVSELKDQRIVKTFSDRDAKVCVVLLLSAVERKSAMDYYRLAPAQPLPSESLAGTAAPDTAAAAAKKRSAGRKGKR